MTTIDDQRAFAVARGLIDIGAVHLNANEPYTLTSGLKSPAYIDCRKVISYPRLRANITDWCCERLDRAVGMEAFDAVAGGETAGIPYAAWIAHELGLPMLYVRKKPKGFGRNAGIEGDLREGSRVLLVEDLTTDGGSKISFAQKLRDAGAQVEHAIVVFYYSIFDFALPRLAKNGLTLHYLATWHDVLRAAEELKSFSHEDTNGLQAFLDNPNQWSKERGGVELDGL